MSVCLTLLVLRNYDELERGGSLYPHSQLEMGQNSGTMGQVVDLQDHQPDGTSPKLNTRPIPPGSQVQIKEEDRPRLTRADGWGEELVWVHAEELGTIDVPDDGAETSDLNRAVRAYMRELPANTPIIIYRH